MKSTIELHLSEVEAQAVTLIQAVEQIDHEGRWLAAAIRRQATREALRANPRDPRWVASRARALVGSLARDQPWLRRALRLTRAPRGLALPATAAAFALGLTTDALGFDRHINVLALPLLAIMAWNLAFVGIAALRRYLPEQDKAPRALGAVQAAARRLTAASDVRGHSDDLGRQVLGRYVTAWFQTSAPLAAARTRQLLHAGALALAAGATAGMYLRGVAFEYRATWESTFLPAEAVDAFLGLLLGPASWLLSIELPPAAAVRAPSSGPAAPWIHLYAATTALVVGLPRLSLLAAEWLRCNRLQSSLTLALSRADLRRIEASVELMPQPLLLLPHSHTPAPPAVARLAELCGELFGPLSRLGVAPTLAYGDEIPGDWPPPEARCVLLLFSLAQTPEAEVHGALASRLRKDVSLGQVAVVAVDASGYRQRLAGLPERDQRVEERRRAWNVMAAADGIELLHLDLSAPLPEDAANRLLLVAWPPDSVGGLS